jgi:hypothetical protein
VIMKMLKVEKNKKNKEKIDASDACLKMHIRVQDMTIAVL